MSVEHELFVQWAEEHFENVQVSGNEVKISDIWWDGGVDTKNKCWVNTEKGCFRAFKSETTGNIFELVMKVEGCSWDEAKEKLGAATLKNLEKKVEDFLFKNKKKPKTEKAKGLDLPDKTFLIRTLLPENPFRLKAEKYLKERKLDLGNLMICTSGRYSNRIIIPYYSSEGELVFFNGRDISGKSNIKYLGASEKEFGVKKSDVLWMSAWPEEGSKVYLTEGEFDAMTLSKSGFYAAACGGKTLNDKQVGLLRPYHVIVCFDSDKAGEYGFRTVISDYLIKKGIRNVGFVRPPLGYKDWNEVLQASNEKVVKAYIQKSEEQTNDYFITTRPLFKDIR